MVWIGNEEIPRQYFPTTLEARRMAIAWLDARPVKSEQVRFYANRGSKEPTAILLMETFDGKRYFSWHRYTKKYGVVSDALYKNGKIDKRGFRTWSTTC